MLVFEICDFWPLYHLKQPTVPQGFSTNLLKPLLTEAKILIAA
jgi:hypothetical protein